MVAAQADADGILAVELRDLDHLPDRRFALHDRVACPQTLGGLEEDRGTDFTTMSDPAGADPDRGGKQDQKDERAELFHGTANRATQGGDSRREAPAASHASQDESRRIKAERLEG